VSKYFYHDKLREAFIHKNEFKGSDDDRYRILLMCFDEYCDKVESLKLNKIAGGTLTFNIYDLSDDGKLCELDLMCLTKLQSK
jgi:hypothetical protein